MVTNRVTFTVGQGQDKHGASIAYRLPDLKHLALTQIAREFGGYTATIGHGGWMDDNGVLIEEKSLTVVVVTDKPYASYRTMARTLATIFNQTSVLLTVESLDEVEFVEQ